MVGLDLLGRLIRALILVYLLEQYGPGTVYDSIIQEQTGDPTKPSVGHSTTCYAYTRNTARLKSPLNYIHLHAFSSSSKGLQSHLQIEGSTTLLEDNRDTNNHSHVS